MGKTHTDIHTHRDIYIYTHTYIYIHTHIYIYIYTHNVNIAIEHRFSDGKC